NDYAWGAGVATDLVNTSATVMVRTGEALPDGDALQRFLADHAIDAEALAGAGGPTDDDLDEVHALRDVVRDALEAETGEDAVAGATALVRRAGRGPALHRDAEGTWQWCAVSEAGASLAAELALLVGIGLLGVLRTLDHDRFRACASPTCSGVFVDTSRAGRRRYCMPDRCGNRVNVANFRSRQRVDGGEG
ncbi:MAG: CGNR zinc finger domain-containing protein, partial [Nocardioidaceae bacterium]